MRNHRSFPTSVFRNSCRSLISQGARDKFTSHIPSYAFTTAAYPLCLPSTAARPRQMSPPPAATPNTGPLRQFQQHCFQSSPITARSSQVLIHSTFSPYARVVPFVKTGTMPSEALTPPSPSAPSSKFTGTNSGSPDTQAFLSSRTHYSNSFGGKGI